MATTLQKIFARELERRLYDNNSFVTESVQDFSGSLVGNTVVVHQETNFADNKIVVNPTFPRTPATKDDNSLTYTLDQIYFDPITATNFDLNQQNYDKKGSQMQQMSAMMADKVAVTCLHNWAAESASNYVRTSGATGGSLPVGVSAAKKKLTYADLLNAQEAIASQNVNMANCYWVMPFALYKEALQLEEVRNNDVLGTRAFSTGQIGTILGMPVYMRSATQLYDITTTPARKAVGATAAATDAYSIMLASSAHVRRFEGNVSVLTDENSPIYGGDVMALDLKFGCAKGRSDEKGIVQIIQENA